MCVRLCFIMFAYWSFQKLVVLSRLIGKMGTFPDFTIIVSDDFLFVTHFLLFHLLLF